jgi:hypothetical protein
MAPLPNPPMQEYKCLHIKSQFVFCNTSSEILCELQGTVVISHFAVAFNILISVRPFTAHKIYASQKYTLKHLCLIVGRAAVFLVRFSEKLQIN